MNIKFGVLSGFIIAFLAVSPSFAAVGAGLLQGSNLDLHGVPTGEALIDFVDRGATITKTADALAVATDEALNLSAGIDKNVVITGNNLQFVGTASVISKFGDPTIDFNRDNSRITAEGGSLNIQSDETLKLIGNEVQIAHNSLKFVNDPKYPIPTIDFVKAGAKITAEDGVRVEGEKGLQVDGPLKVGGATTLGNGLTISAGGLNVAGTTTFSGGISLNGNAITFGNTLPSEPCHLADLAVYRNGNNPALYICIHDGGLGNIWTLIGPEILPM